MAIPDYPAVRAPSIEDLAEIETAARQTAYGLSEFSTGFIFGYLESLELEASKINGNICIFGRYLKKHFFLPPLGSNKINETVNTCFKHLKEKYGGGRFVAAPKEFLRRFQDNPRYEIESDRNNFDYTYLTKDLIDLPGSKYQAKRNLVAQFKRNYDYRLVEMDKRVLFACMQLQEKWCNIKSCLMDESMSMESRFVFKILSNYHKLKLLGAAIIINDEVEAFAVGEALDDSTAVIHIEKANTHFRGIYQAINNFFCSEKLKSFKFVNREQDMGDDGLRKAKMSYYPHHFAEKYIISQK
ncbi:MAG TPA: hypothetical protein DEE98_05155 [Elusimicrobia bacterium]|nr:MAG: hypothetical protein A2278_04830 [Elusimicrobia bacterium RIFOXYA12_FULL_49_49]OGS06258.1 MAG: hypothetical protein A2204_06195 [Elusimicrobia bacterium RIFOXYA1_FULL_47_7]OGS14628.1 MAG: hypothetical protein A2251_09010 [Elusimicrobia bacterium RIFOXYA2_FULL_47_53]OGS25719.1 MAG: hypothetical protein A2339_06580 [Elusimicrobia bacterium RIFOXYB12_FULL_50_12]OGS31719.1 MAG: hypothetical protein A2323_05920 [Elusimicrobia bacterium RIFOXYB2_FULL_46_23]HBU69753.1 hypothetical protein [El